MIPEFQSHPWDEQDQMPINYLAMWMGKEAGKQVGGESRCVFKLRHHHQGNPHTHRGGEEPAQVPPLHAQWSSEVGTLRGRCMLWQCPPPRRAKQQVTPKDHVI